MNNESVKRGAEGELKRDFSPSREYHGRKFKSNSSPIPILNPRYIVQHGTSDFITSVKAVDISNNNICNSDVAANLNTRSIIADVIFAE